MNIDELRWFAALAEREHMTAVATRAAHQPARAVAGDRRDWRHNSASRCSTAAAASCALNHHGRRYLALRAAARSTQLDAGAAALADVADAERGELRLWFLHTLGSWLVPALVGAFREDHPGVRFRLAQRGGRRRWSSALRRRRRRPAC